MKKCAFIRSETGGEGKCPFGLPITQGCENAGNSVTKMCPLKIVTDEEKESVKLANSRIYVYYKTGDRCIYAANIIKAKQATNCSFGDSAAGMSHPAFVGSPLYVDQFAGCGLDGLYAYPLGFYADTNQSRNLFEGLFSLIGEYNYDLIKYAISKNILENLESGKQLTTEERLELENTIMKCKEEFDEQLDNNEKIDKTLRKWWRQ